MEAFIDFFNRYMMGGIQIVTEFIFFTAFLGKKGKPSIYILFSVFGLLLLELFQTGGAADVFIYTLLLAGLREDAGCVLCGRKS